MQKLHRKLLVVITGYWQLSAIWLMIVRRELGLGHSVFFGIVDRNTILSWGDNTVLEPNKVIIQFYQKLLTVHVHYQWLFDKRWNEANVPLPDDRTNILDHSFAYYHFYLLVEKCCPHRIAFPNCTVITESFLSSFVRYQTWSSFSTKEACTVHIRVIRTTK